MAVHARLARHRLALFGCVSIAVPPDRPCPAGRDHHRLQVIVPGEALRHRLIRGGIEVHLLAGHRAAGDEVLERLPGERCRLPMAVVAGLSLRRHVDREQAHDLGPEADRVAVDDLEPRL
jgi:hypothetical protein